jgi:hypothetical protein
VKKYLALWIALSNLSFWLIPTGLHAREPQIKVEQVLQATQSWDSRPYTSYPAGQPQVTVLRITIRPILLCIGIATRSSVLATCYLDTLRWKKGHSAVFCG